jgi:hypothetical protein
MEDNHPLEAVTQQFLFTMSVVCMDEIFNCRVFTAVQRDGTQFTRVLYDEGPDERIIDVDYRGEQGWIDLWYGEPSPWSALVAAALNYHFAQNKKH